MKVAQFDDVPLWSAKGNQTEAFLDKKKMEMAAAKDLDGLRTLRDAISSYDEKGGVRRAKTYYSQQFWTGLDAIRQQLEESEGLRPADKSKDADPNEKDAGNKEVVSPGKDADVAGDKNQADASDASVAEAKARLAAAAAEEAEERVKALTAKKEAAAAALAAATARAGNKSGGKEPADSPDQNNDGSADGKGGSPHSYDSQICFTGDDGQIFHGQVVTKKRSRTTNGIAMVGGVYYALDAYQTEHVSWCTANDLLHEFAPNLATQLEGFHRKTNVSHSAERLAPLIVALMGYAPFFPMFFDFLLAAASYASKDGSCPWILENRLQAIFWEGSLMPSSLSSAFNDLQELCKWQRRGPAAARLHPFLGTVRHQKHICHLLAELVAWWIIRHTPSMDIQLQEIVYVATQMDDTMATGVALKGRTYMDRELTTLSVAADKRAKNHLRLLGFSAATRSGANCTGERHAQQTVEDEVSQACQRQQPPPPAVHGGGSSATPPTANPGSNPPNRATTFNGHQVKSITVNGKTIQLPTNEVMRRVVLPAGVCVFCGGTDHTLDTSQINDGCGKGPKLPGYTPERKFAAVWAKLTKKY